MNQPLTQQELLEFISKAEIWLSEPLQRETPAGLQRIQIVRSIWEPLRELEIKFEIALYNVDPRRYRKRNPRTPAEELGLDPSDPTSALMIAGTIAGMILQVPIEVWKQAAAMPGLDPIFRRNIEAFIGVAGDLFADPQSIERIQ